MAKNWKDVKASIEKDLDRIMWEEPVEVKMSRLGVFPSGAGTGGQYLSNLVFQVADTQGMSWWTAEPAMQQAIADPDLDVEHCKKFFKYINHHMAHLMGDVAQPNCPAPWMNLPTFSQFSDEIVESFPTIRTKEEFADLLWSWFNYTERFNRWFFLIFPWHLGEDYPLKTRAEVDAMIKNGEVPESARIPATNLKNKQ